MRISSSACSLFAALPLLAACPGACGDDDGAALSWSPGEAAMRGLATGALATVTIVDDCGAAFLSSCTTETVSEIVTLEYDDEVLEVTPVATNVTQHTVRALAPGESQLFIAARFDGDEEGVRSAEEDKLVADAVSASFAPECRFGAAAEPWLLPSGQAASVALSYTAAAGDRLFHHDVDWSATLAFPDGAPAGLDAATRSPATVPLTFTGSGARGVDDQSGARVADVALYDEADVDDFALIAPSSPIEVGEQIAIPVVTIVDGAVVCAPHEGVALTATIEDGDVCSFDEEIAGVTSRTLTAAGSLSLYGHAAGTCRVTVTDGASLSAEASFDVVEAPAVDD